MVGKDVGLTVAAIGEECDTDQSKKAATHS
jgi:hypothetical protein